jgi:hypothetical protein
MAERITKTELARKLGVTKSRVSQLCRAGLPVGSDGRVELQSALSWVTTHVDQSRGRWNTSRTAQTPVPQPVQTSAARANTSFDTSRPVLDPGRALLIARARKALAEAKRAERAERRQAGELIEADAVKQFVSQLCMLVRDHSLSQADRLAATLAAATGASEIHRLIRNDNNAMLTKLSKQVASLTL